MLLDMSTATAMKTEGDAMTMIDDTFRGLHRLHSHLHH
jgi:hypothetical protein